MVARGEKSRQTRGVAHMRFNVLGPLEIMTEDARVLHLKAPKASQVVGLLLLRVGQTVTTDALIRDLWGEKPPRSAATTLQTHIYYARKFFDLNLPPACGRQILVTRPYGYAMQVEPGAVDAIRFERMIAEARAFLGQDRVADAVAALDGALGLWRGRPLANIAASDAISAHADQLEELRLRAVELRIEAQMRCGRHRDLVGELRELTTAHPFHEWFHGQLIRALARSGRRAEALQAYKDLRRLLDEELGVEPALEIQKLRHEILARSHSTAAMA